jgi:macrolide-specific efflux system membrane fusion protein
MGRFLSFFQSHRRCFFIAILSFFFLIFIFIKLFSERASLVSVDKVRRGTIIESVYGIGTVISNKTFQFKVGVPSSIRKVYVKEGDFVKAGQKIVDLEGVHSSAPYAGVVTFLPVKEGETVFAQSIVYVLSDLSDRYLTVSLEQRGAIKVRQGQKAKISFESLRDKTFQGIVESIYSFESNFLVRIGVSDLPSQILPGMTADVAIGINEFQGRLVVPVSAMSEGLLSFKREGKKMRVPVQIGIVEGAFAEVIKGDVKEGDELILPSQGK